MLSAVGIEHVRVDVLSLLSDEAKALILGPMLDMRRAVEKGGSQQSLRVVDSLIRRVGRGLYEYELRKVDALRVLDIDVTTW
ncbi:MAG TPA: hypothetical protein DCZ11_03190 [Gammaproteobacteria bacterium]|nr:hypothetical protein [Gammaproteobacteria bacterium]MCH77431.1 hypothetical protein [Gammaproteobacteria bacterium]